MISRLRSGIARSFARSASTVPALPHSPLADEPLTDDEILLRRFSPTNPNQVLKDEGTGRYVLNFAGLRFDEDGCSVHREEVMAELGMQREDVVVDDQHTGIAIGSKGAVELYAFDGTAGPVHPFRAEASPRTDPPPHRLDRAHASIRDVECGLSARHVKRARGRMAKAAFTVVTEVNL